MSLRKPKIQTGLTLSPKNNLAQATIEITLGLIVAFLFLGAILRFFVNANQNIVNSQVAYQNSRAQVIENIGSASEDAFIPYKTGEGELYYGDSGTGIEKGLDMTKPKLLAK